MAMQQLGSQHALHLHYLHPETDMKDLGCDWVVLEITITITRSRSRVDAVDGSPRSALISPDHPDQP